MRAKIQVIAPPSLTSYLMTILDLRGLQFFESRGMYDGGYEQLSRYKSFRNI